MSHDSDDCDCCDTTDDLIDEMGLKQSEEENQFAYDAQERMVRMLRRYGFPAGPAADMFRQIWDAGRVAGARQRERVLQEMERQLMRQAHGLPAVAPKEFLN